MMMMMMMMMIMMLMMMMIMMMMIIIITIAEAATATKQYNILRPVSIAQTHYKHAKDRSATFTLRLG